MTYLSSLLRTARQTLTSPSTPLPIVLGNSACDLDSFASSLLYSYLTPTRPRPIPLLPIPRSDLPLRPELLHLLHLLLIPESDLLFTSDLPANHPLSVHLVDHNTNPDYPDVAGIIDHHKDEGKHKEAEPRVIQKAGSCSSLVFTHFNAAEKISDEKERREIGKLVLAPVLVDTADLGDPNTTTEVDKEVVKTIESWLGFHRRPFYEGIVTAKKNIAGMSVRDLMRKDYKEWEEDGVKVGFSSVVRGFAWLEKKEGLLEGVREWAVERGNDVGVVMTTDDEDGVFRRELMVWGVTEVGRGVVRRLVERAEEGGLQLSTWGDARLDGDEGNRRVWNQGNVGMSRKQVAPFVRECMKGLRVESKV